jgi:hypothetical protein
LVVGVAGGVQPPVYPDVPLAGVVAVGVVVVAVVDVPFIFL